MRCLRKIAWDCSGAGAAEFALVVPLLLILIFGIIDAGRLAWTWNQAEKATHTGARVAIATALVPSALADYSFASDGGLPAGSSISSTALENLTCDSTGCTNCVGDICGELAADYGYNPEAFANIVARMAEMYPQITAEDVLIDYKHVGLGYAGDPNGSDLSPLTTVKLRNLAFEPVTLLVFSGSIPLPDFRASLTLEDGRGFNSN